MLLFKEECQAHTKRAKVYRLLEMARNPAMQPQTSECDNGVNHDYLC